MGKNNFVSNKVTIQNTPIAGLEYMNLGQGIESKFLITKLDKKNEPQHIATSNSCEINILDKDEIEYLQRTAFKNITCNFCRDNISALWIMKTEAGFICRYCWHNLYPSIEWITLDDLKIYGRK